MSNGIRFRLNRYNWLGQKLLAQHQYGDIIRLRQCIANELDLANSGGGGGSQRRCPISEHLIYVNSLAMMKTSTHLDEVIFSLQQLNLDKSRQYFLLLCQCLLYLGNYDSVVALCKQAINKEIDSVEPKREDSFNDDDQSMIDFSKPNEQLEASKNNLPKSINQHWNLTETIQESVEFKRVLANINKNKLINEPRLWFIFGVCLEYQHQYNSAHFAFEVAAKLAGNSSANSYPDKPAHRQDQAATAAVAAASLIEQAPATTSCYNYAPLTSYAERCVYNNADYRGAIQLLSRISGKLPPNFQVHLLLALILSAQPNANQSNFGKAMEIISSLEVHSASTRNPSLVYNQLALKCARKLAYYNQSQIFIADHDRRMPETGDEIRYNLGYLLARSYIVLNSLVQNSDKSSHLFKFNTKQEHLFDRGNTNEIDGTIESLIVALRNSDSSCWSSAMLWNNLGLCYLARKRFIACMSCLMKAVQLNPLDWRINYNLALACIHVNLHSRAITHLLAARDLYAKSQPKLTALQRKSHEFKNNPLITSLMAICYDHLAEDDEARRLHIEATRPLEPSSLANSAPIMSILNYLCFLDKERLQNGDPECSKIIFHLLDQLEQRWLQRDQHDAQFNLQLLDVARQIGQRASNRSTTRAQKVYAWTKHTRFDDR